MTLKTAVWELWNMMKPFIQMPQDLLKDLEEISKSEVDFNNQDYINVEVEEVKEVVENKVASEEVTATFDDDIENETPQFSSFKDTLF